jgi:hypothetical protein
MFGFVPAFRFFSSDVIETSGLFLHTLGLEVVDPHVTILCGFPVSTPQGAWRLFVEFDLPKNHSLPAVFVF